ncbi:MAG: DUF2934 domain-containing protein [Spirochaetia bacterium]|nr:DUF2934 domain-containing protein [Spirochaetia bacterium]
MAKSNGQKKTQKKPDAKTVVEETRKLAEEIYKKRVADNKPGNAESDWVQAENEIKAKYGL